MLVCYTMASNLSKLDMGQVLEGIHTCEQVVPCMSKIKWI